MARLQSEVELLCPCCGATLVLDKTLGRIVSHREPERTDKPELHEAHRILAAEAARDATIVAPFRESGYRLLMEAHAAAGNSAEALWVYERVRSLISEELGVLPSVETRAIYQRLLQRL